MGGQSCQETAAPAYTSAVDDELRLDEWIGREIAVVIDRPLGSRHPLHPDILYTVNYGYVAGTAAPDDEPLDVYVLGADGPLDRCTATVIAVVRRRDDVEDKLVAAVAGQWDEAAIATAVAFQEQYFDAWVELPARASRP